MTYYLQAILWFGLLVSSSSAFAQRAMSCAGGAKQVFNGQQYVCPSNSAVDLSWADNSKSSGQKGGDCTSCQDSNSSQKCCACHNGAWSVDDVNGGEFCYIAGSNPCLKASYRNQSAQSCRECGGNWNTSSGTCGGTAQQAQDPAAANACLAQYQTLVNACETSKTEAVNACDQDQNSGMNNVSNIASQIALVLGQATSSSTHLACSKMGSLAQAANAAVLAFQGTCQSSMSSCVSSCSEAASYLTQNKAVCFPGLTETALQEQVKAYMAQATTPGSTCKGLDAKIQQAQMAMNNIQQTANSSAACAQDTAGIPDLCAANPTLAGCTNGIVDCSSPTMANDKVCICTKNPSDPACITAKNSTDPYGGSQDFSSRLAGSTTTSFSGDDIPGLDQIAQGSKSGGGGRGVDGKVGGGAGIAGGDGGGGGMGGARGGGGAEEDPTRVTAGFYGSGGGGGMGGGARGAAGAGGGRYGAQAGAGGAAGGPDLRAFLPGGKYDPRQRGLAGATGVDGITGPHTNIWKKIQNRYQATSPTLLP